MDPLLAWRSEFPILADTVYLVSHSLGAMPARTRARLNEFADTWATRGVRAWEEGWWDLPVTTGNLLAPIIGAAPGEITLHQNVSTAQAIVNSCLDFPPSRNKIVTESLNFTTNLYLFHRLESLGAQIVTVPSDDGLSISTERYLASIDERTRLVSVSHVLFKSSALQDLAAITARAHACGALVSADLYQSAGAVPIDVHALNLDFATGGSVKWLCGGPGAGYLYVRPDLWPSLEPRFTGWAAHRNPFAFDAAPIEFAPGAERFLHGTPNVPALYSARSGYEIINEIGVQAIREKSIRQTSRLIELAREAGIPVRTPSDPARRGGVVTLDVPNGADVTRALARQNILVDFRPGAGIRVAPHFYTADEELDLAVSAIQSLAAAPELA